MGGAAHSASALACPEDHMGTHFLRVIQHPNYSTAKWVLGQTSQGPGMRTCVEDGQVLMENDFQAGSSPQSP
eukprot:1161579-Pelagomonas_calceolata.AAC.20